MVVTLLLCPDDGSVRVTLKVKRRAANVVGDPKRQKQGEAAPRDGSATLPHTTSPSNESNDTPQATPTSKNYIDAHVRTLPGAYDF
jgi:hypothetical protein